MLKTVWYKSWTKFLGYCQVVSGGILATLSTLNIYVSDPMFKSYLDLLSVPKYVYIGVATLGILVWLAHGRDKDV